MYLFPNDFSNFLDVIFDDNALDQLVMNLTNFQFVTSNHKELDIINGKGGDYIFLLHGPPGGL